MLGLQKHVTISRENILFKGDLVGVEVNKPLQVVPMAKSPFVQSTLLGNQAAAFQEPGESCVEGWPGSCILQPSSRPDGSKDAQSTQLWTN